MGELRERRTVMQSLLRGHDDVGRPRFRSCPSTSSGRAGWVGFSGCLSHVVRHAHPRIKYGAGYERDGRDTPTHALPRVSEASRVHSFGDLPALIVVPLQLSEACFTLMNQLILRHGSMKRRRSPTYEVLDAPMVPIQGLACELSLVLSSDYSGRPGRYPPQWQDE